MNTRIFLIPVLLLLFFSPAFGFTVTGTAREVGEHSGDVYAELGCEIIKYASFCVKVDPKGQEAIDASGLLVRDSAEFSFKAGGYYYPGVLNINSGEWAEHEIYELGNLPLATLLCYYNGRAADCSPEWDAHSQPRPLLHEQPVDAGGKNGIAVFRITKITGPYLEEGSFRPFYYFRNHGELGEEVEIEFQVKFMDPGSMDGGYYPDFFTSGDKWFSSQEEINDYLGFLMGEGFGNILPESQRIVSGTTTQEHDGRRDNVSQWTADAAKDYLERLQAVFVPFDSVDQFVLRARFMPEQFMDWQKGRDEAISFFGTGASAPHSSVDDARANADDLVKWFELYGFEKSSDYAFRLTEFRPAVYEMSGGELKEVRKAEAMIKAAAPFEGTEGEQELFACGTGRIFSFISEEMGWNTCEKSSGGSLFLIRLKNVEGPYYLREGSRYSLKPRQGTDSYEISVPFELKFRTISSLLDSVSDGSFTPVLSSQSELSKYLEGETLTVSILDGEATRNPVSGATVRVGNNALGFSQMQKDTPGHGRVEFTVPMDFPFNISVDHDLLGGASTSIDYVTSEPVELYLSSEYIRNYYAVIGEELEQAFLGIMLGESTTPLGSLGEVYARLHEFFNLLDSDGNPVEYEVMQPFAEEMTFVYVNDQGEKEFITRPVTKILRFDTIEKGKCYTMEIVTNTPDGKAAVLQEWCLREDGVVVANEKPRVERR